VLENIILWIVCIFLAIYVLSIVISPLYFKWGKIKWFYHDVMEWHMPNEDDPEYFDGCSVHAKCKHCGKGIMQDSQGNWF
jgi:hypothetical protein